MGSAGIHIKQKHCHGFRRFKNHYAIWFHQGIFLKDTEKKLVNTQKGKTQALRQWKFVEGSKIDLGLVKSYILEAIENCKAGKKLAPNTKKVLLIPELLKSVFLENKNLELSFHKLSPEKQRNYAAHISSSKREATQISRLEKIIPMILDGKGLHDKYKNC